MKTILGIIALACALTACNDEPNPLCHCIQKSEALNQLSNEILYMNNVSQEKHNELIRLRKEIDSICEPFKMMGPEALYKMRNECIDPELLELNQ